MVSNIARVVGESDREVGVDEELGRELVDRAFSFAGIEPTLEASLQDRTPRNRLEHHDCLWFKGSAARA